MKRQRRQHYLGLVSLLVVIMVIGAVIIWHRPVSAPGTNATSSNKSATPTPASFNKNQYSLSDPTSLWVIVNKQRPLPSSYVPADLVTPAVPLRLAAGNEEMHLRQTAASALKQLFDGANTAGYRLLIASGYRSYVFQQALYARYVAQDGAAAADTYSARAGFSEHQTGLAADVGRGDHKCEVEACFGDTAEGQWLAANAYKYGFVLRYPLGKQSVTGYIYEPWHLRYVGKDLSQAVHDSGQTTLEEFFGLPAAASY